MVSAQNTRSTHLQKRKLGDLWGKISVQWLFSSNQGEHIRSAPGGIWKWLELSRQIWGHFPSVDLPLNSLMLWNDIWRGKHKPTTRWIFALKQTAIAQKHKYSGTTIQRSAKGLAKYVHLNKVCYIEVLFHIFCFNWGTEYHPLYQGLPYRGALYWGSTVLHKRGKASHCYQISFPYVMLILTFLYKL